MKTRILMASSAVLMGVAGIAPPAGLAVVMTQVLGALYLGFAILNWTARGVLIGGVYAKPLALGNFLHFTVVAVILLKALVAPGPATPALWVAAGVYLVFAVWFGGTLFTHPS
jgi:hypothetical protein